jgi:8-oxo-dGTP pyrophosphatase MutT (NUDIX family)
VYHTYCPNWHLPGGGVKKGEHPLDAVQREIYEESGIRCVEPPILFGVYYQKYRQADDYPILYSVHRWTQEKVTSPEIKDCQWFPIHALPNDMDPGSRARIEEYCFGAKPSLYWNPKKNKKREQA